MGGGILITRHKWMKLHENEKQKGRIFESQSRGFRYMRCKGKRLTR